MGGYNSGLPIINIVPPSPPVGTGTTFSIFGSISAVPVNSTESILTLTIPPGGTAFLEKVDVSGDNIAIYTIYKNGDIISRLRTYFGSALNASLVVSGDGADGLPLVAGDVIDVQVFNFRPWAATFDARIQYTE